MGSSRGTRGLAVLFSVLMVTSVVAVVAAVPVAAAPVGAHASAGPASVVDATGSDHESAVAANSLVTFDDTIGGVETVGALRIRVVNGNVRVSRWTGAAWSGQYFPGGPGGSAEASDTALYVDGTLYQLPGGATASPSGAQLTADNQFVTDGGTTVVSEFRTPEGVELVQRITYVAPEQKFDLRWEVTNDGGSSVSDLRLFNTKDTFLAGDDNGNGFWDGSTDTIGVQKTIGGELQRLSMRGITDPFAYQSNNWRAVRFRVSNGALINFVDTADHDNAYALEWRRATLGVGDTWTVRARESFSLSPIIVTGPGTVTLSGDTIDLEFDVENFGSTSATVSFATNGPSGWTVSTPGDITLASGASQTVTVTADPPSGTAAGFYDVELTASGGGSSDTGVAQVEVVSSTTLVDDCRVIDTPGDYALSRDITQTNPESCIVITSSDVNFDGAGFTIDNAAGTGSDRFAVDADGRSVGGLSNVVVQNVEAVGFDGGIGLRQTDNSVVQDVATGPNRVIGVDVRTGSGGNSITNVESTDSGLAGVRLSGDGDNTVENVVVDGSTYGIDVASSNNAVSDVVVTDSESADVRLGSGSGNVVTDLTMASATIAELSGTRITVARVDSPPTVPVTAQSIGQYIDVESTGTGSSMSVVFGYADGDVGGADESMLLLWSYNETTGVWTQVSGSTVDTAANEVSGDLSSFSVVAPLVPISADAVAPTVSNFDAINPSGQTFEVQFDADEALDDIEVAVSDGSGTTVATFTEADFAVSGQTYTASTDLGTDGTFTATLNRAVDAAGNDGATGQADTVTIDTSVTDPKITRFDAANPDGQDLRVRFDSDTTLDDIEVAVTDDATLNRVATLTEADFSTSPRGSETRYRAVVDLGADGTFTATLLRAADGAGNDGATGQEDTVTIDTSAPDVTAFRASNPGDRTIRVAFDSSKPLSEIRVVVTDLGTGEPLTRLTEADFSRSGDRYLATVEAPGDGRYRVTLNRARDDAGRNGAAGQRVIVVVDSVVPVVGDFTVTNPRDRLVTASFTSSEPLTDVIVNIVGEDGELIHGLPAAIFTRSDGRYTATVNIGRTGTFTGVLRAATDAGGNDAAAGQRDSVTISDPSVPDTTVPEVVRFDATNPSGRTVSVAVASNEPLSTIAVDVADSTGDLVTSLSRADFAIVDGEYVATVTVAGSDTYTATLLESTDAAGNDGATGQTATVEVSLDSAADYAGEDGVVDTDELRTAVRDWSDGTIDTALLRAVVAAWSSGDPV